MISGFEYSTRYVKVCEQRIYFGLHDGVDEEIETTDDYVAKYKLSLDYAYTMVYTMLSTLDNVTYFKNAKESLPLIHSKYYDMIIF